MTTTKSEVGNNGKSRTKKSRKDSKAKPRPEPQPSSNGVPEAHPRFHTEHISRCISAAQVQRIQVQWLWPSYVPLGLLTLLVGESRSGKSTLLAAIAASVSQGTGAFTADCDIPRPVLMYSQEEDPWTTLRPRLEAHGAGLTRIHFGDYGPDGKMLPRMMLPGDTVRLGNLIHELRAGLLIIDPVTAYLTSGTDSRDDQAVRALLDGLAQIAASTGCTILLTRHYRKSREGGPLDWVGGSGAWTHVPRVVLACGFDPDAPTQRLLAVPKNSLSRDVPSIRYSIEDCAGVGKLTLGDECGITAEDMGIGNMAPADRDALADAVAYLLDALSDGERPAKDIVKTAQECGISLGTLRRGKTKAGVTSHPVGPNGQRYQVWRLPAKQVQE